MTLLGVLGLAVAGLALDRVVLGPGDASAGVGPVAEGAGSGGEGSEGVGVEGARGVLGEYESDPVAAALRELSRRRGAADVGRDQIASLFGEPAAWAVRAAEVAEAASEAAERASGESSAAGLELTAVFAGERPMAIINGRAVGVGAWVSGYRVAEIGASGVKLASPGGGGDVRLRMPRGR
jgi:hypothetical protein